MLIEELKFPAPWGHIAAKAWGDKQNATVICIHGLLDNAGSFDTLIPLLPENFYYVCVELPGHGLSSHYDKSLPVSFHNLLLPIKVVCDFLSRESYVFLGHSVGARLLVTHCQLYPESASKLVLLDSTYSLPKPPIMYLNSLESAFDSLKKYLSYKPEGQPLLSYEDAVRKIMSGRFTGTLTYETAEQLTKRLVQKVGDKYRFTFDSRLKALMEPPLDMEYIEELLKVRPLECPVIIFAMSETNELFERYEFSKNYMDVIKDAEKHDIEGHHHTHHTSPELIATQISKFLLKDRYKL